MSEPFEHLNNFTVAALVVLSADHYLRELRASSRAIIRFDIGPLGIGIIAYATLH
jgi:hypothetical protein